jgi:hypothetical protein
MAGNEHLFGVVLNNIIKNVNEINFQIVSRKINSILTIKKFFVLLKKNVEETIPKNLVIPYKNRNIDCYQELNNEIENQFNISTQLFKSYWWGEFSGLNKTKFPELYSMMVDQNGDLLRSFDDFSGTVAVMDFHGYTEFSKDIKYNKTPLQEFGDIMPQKIETICSFCKCIVYEMEGDALIIIGPENPIFIFDAVLCIIELCRQKPFNPNSNPKAFHHIDISNPMIKPFEINAAVTTGGKVFINKNGRIIGSLISEASRISKIINTKKPNKSGILISEKLYRKYEKYKDTPTNSHVSINSFSISDPFLVDVKGTRLNLREIYLEQRNYIDDTNNTSKKLAEEIKKNNPSKWQNILSFYINLLTACLNDIKTNIQYGKENYNQDKIKKRLEMLFYEWISNPTPETIRELLRISDAIFEVSEEIRDVASIYHDFVHENYHFIAERLEEFYQASLEKECQTSMQTKKNVELYKKELERIKTKFPAKRILSTIFSNDKINSQMLDVPYMGKK